jgi:hypothetical protein
LSVVEGLGVALTVEVAVPARVGLGLPLSLELAEALELVLALEDALALALALPLAVLTGLPVGDVAGVLCAPVDAGVRLGELDVDDVGDECTDGDVQGDFDGLGTTPVTGVPDCPATDGAGVLG